MRDLEVLFKLVLPAVLLIFWALSNLFNREQKAAMAREQRNPALGPRPGRPVPVPRERYSPSATPNPSRGGNNPNDEILIIRSETNRPTSRPPQPQRRVNPGRGRAAPVPAPRRSEPPSRPKEQLGGRIDADVSQTLGKPMEVRPLSEQIADAPRGADTGSLPTLSRVEAPLASSLDLLAVMADPTQIRVAIILNEVFQPPVSQRRHHPGRS